MTLKARKNFSYKTQSTFIREKLTTMITFILKSYVHYNVLFKKTQKIKHNHTGLEKFLFVLFSSNVYDQVSRRKFQKCKELSISNKRNPAETKS